MAAGFPIAVAGTAFRTTEALYQAMRFPEHPAVQREIIDQRSPMGAKVVARREDGYTRSDWMTVRREVMRWCLLVKAVQHLETFAILLRECPAPSIVEESSRDEYWGAVPRPDGMLRGANMLGCLLMELREQLVRTPDGPCSAAPPPLSGAVLMGIPISVVHASDRPQEPQLHLFQ